MSGDDDYDDPLDDFFGRGFARLGAPLFPDGAWFHGFSNLRKCGKGGQGEVYVAWDGCHGRFVALKFPLLSQAAPPPAGATPAGPTQPYHANPLLAEARRAAGLGLPHVVTVYHFHDDPGLPFLEMEYAAGGKLLDWKDACRANPRLLADWLIPVCRNLDLAHRSGLIHKDIKPGNLLLVYPVPTVVPEDGSPPPLPDPRALPPDRLLCKMADFGLSGPSGDAALGLTPGYAPPEQLRGQVDPTADVFALGATIHALLTGAAPGPQPEQAYTPPDGSALALAGIDPDLRSIVLRALRAAPGRPYESAAGLADDLERWRRGDSIESTPVVRRLWLWVRKQPASIKAASALAAVLVVVAAGLGIWVAVATQQAGREATAAAEAKAVAADAKAAEADARQEEARAKVAAAELAGRSAHALRLAAARDLAAVGRWAQALPEFGALLDDPLTGPALRRRLRVEMLPGLLAVHRLADFDRDLNELAGRDDLGPLAAPVRLYQAERLSWRRSGAAEARKALGDALPLFRNPPPGDRPAGWDGDAAYAEALAAETPKQMVDLLKAALARAPYHYPARRTLLVALAAQGRFRRESTPWGTASEFEEQAEFARRHFPDSPVADFAAALVGVLRDGREPDAARLGIAAGLDEGGRLRLRRLFAEIVACRGIIRDIRQVRDSVPQYLGPAAGGQFAFLAEAWKIQSVVAGGGVLAGLGDSLFPQIGLPYLAFAPLPETFQSFHHYTAVWTGGPNELREAIRSLEAVHARHPEALLLYFVACLRTQLVCELLNEKKEAEALGELTRIPDAVARGNRAPTLAPGSPFTYRTQAASAMAVGLILRLDPNAAAGTRDQLQEVVDRLIKLGRAFPAIRPEVVRATLVTLDGRPSPVEQTAWKLDTEDGRIKYKARKGLLLDSLARPLLNDWATEDQNGGVGDGEPKKLLEQVRAWAEE